MLVLVMASSCSFIASTTPPGMSSSCMPSRRGPHADTAVVAFAAIIDLALLAASTGSACKGDFGCLGLAAGGAVVTIIASPFLASAIYGYVKDECTEEALNQPPLPPPPPLTRKQCLAQRVEIAKRAQDTSDGDERTRLLKSLPQCAEDAESNESH
jgi:hypothetical protein